jgi:hypothetical protein
LKASSVDWIKWKTEYQGIKTRKINENIQTMIKKEKEIKNEYMNRTSKNIIK